MSKITRIDAGRQALARASHALERRTVRLARRLLGLRAPIVWLCATAGSGKTRLLEHLRPTLTERGYGLLDDPEPSTLERELKTATEMTPGSRRRLLVASRPTSAAAPLLLKPRAYGLVEALVDAELFVRVDDTRAGEEALLAATGGWPWLVDAALDGREAEVRALLPGFLEREVLPELSEDALAALFAAVSMPLPARALETLVVPCGLLVNEGGETRVAGEWVRSALSSLRRGSAARAPGVRERVMKLYASLTDPAPAIAAQLNVGDSSAAFELFRRAGGAY